MNSAITEIIRQKNLFKRLPLGERLALAEEGWRRSLRWSNANSYGVQPKVTVLRAQGKPLIVLRAGRYFVSSFTWQTLIEKAALGPWKKIAGTTLERRLP